MSFLTYPFSINLKLIFAVKSLTIAKQRNRTFLSTNSGILAANNHPSAAYIGKGF
jgi:hypothetical protein